MIMGKDTIFDLASLTKPLATTLAVMSLVDDSKIRIDQTLSELLSVSIPHDKQGLTVRWLLCHSAGLVDWKPFYEKLIDYRPEERKTILGDLILEEPLAYTPGTGCVYSDLGFMILEWIIVEVSGMSMDRFVDERFYRPLRLKRTFLWTKQGYRRYKKGEFAATEECPWRKKVLQGEVHDDNAFALGGYSGHAGLFGTADEVWQLVNLIREHYLGKRKDYVNPETVRQFFAKQDAIAGCPRALGWDMPSPEGSSAGKYFSPNSVGHLGFTGTSVWMDLEKDVVVILLTNRVHPTRSNEKIKEFRPKLHDCVMQTLGLSDKSD
jgi:CubicO group peptidase (beta-lactamase class C family)